MNAQPGQLIEATHKLKGATFLNAGANEYCLARTRATVARIANEAEGSFGLTHPEALGSAAVQFIRPDPLSSARARARVEFNVTFALGDKVIELKYQKVDDGKLNKVTNKCISIHTQIQPELNENCEILYFR